MPRISRVTCAVTFLGVLLSVVPLRAQEDGGEEPVLRVLLTSTTQNVHRDTFSVTRDKLGVGKVAWRIDKRTLHGGKQEGVDVVTIENGEIIITVMPTRGMSVLDVRDTRTNERLLGWDSPVKEVVHPRHINLDSRGGLGWLEGFNEWMVRCGLELAGQPGKDPFITNTGETAEMDLTLHGKIGNIPASEVELIVDKQPPHRIRLRGTVYERMFYGPKLKLVAEVSTVAGSRELRFDDRVTNEGAAPQEFQLIYHANLGTPLLEAGSTLVAAAREVAPMNAHAVKGLSGYATYVGPTQGFIEQVYLIRPYADDRGNTTVLLRNATKSRGAAVRWSTKQLPYLTIWKNTAAVKDGYVTGIEPATGYPFNRSVERKTGRLAKLSPGQTRQFSLEFSLLQGDAVQGAADAIRALQGDRPTRMIKQPPEVPE